MASLAEPDVATVNRIEAERSDLTTER